MKTYSDFVLILLIISNWELSYLSFTVWRVWRRFCGHVGWHVLLCSSWHPGQQFYCSSWRYWYYPAIYRLGSWWYVTSFWYEECSFLLRSRWIYIYIYILNDVGKFLRKSPLDSSLNSKTYRQLTLPTRTNCGVI